MSQRDEEWLWTVGSDLQRLGQELNRSRPGVATGRFWEPRVDVIEDKHKILIRAEIAGVRGEEIGLLYVPERHALLIRGERQEADAGDGTEGSYIQMEIPFGQFQREVKLPDVAIRPDEIRAQFRNGFLIVMIPKQERFVVTKTITVTKH